MLKGTATLAGGAWAAPYIVPASVLGRNGAVPPSEKIVVGGIGIGRRGTHDLKWMLPEKDVQFVAVCDAQKSRREAVKKLVDTTYGNSDCKVYGDLREFLEQRKDIDAVLIATGDRWHAPAAVMAMRAGKDVFSEKPSCMTIEEGKAVMDTARSLGRVYQTCTQRLSEPNFVFCFEMARSGRLGEVHTARAHIAPWDAAELKHEWLPPEPLPPKDEVDWDLWLGPCRWRPFNSSYVRGAWRGHYDFHTSCIGEWGAHTFAQCQAGLNLLDTSPVEYEYVKNTTGDGMVTRFANGVKMTLHREGYWRGSCGMRFEGTEGWVAAADNYERPDVSDPAMLADFDKIVSAYKERTGRALNHMRNFLDCVRSRQQPVANADVMYHTMTTVHAANICMWLKRDMKFDPAKAEFADADANGFRSRPMRAPWTI
ncbi:MAG TPA: Gfo/Idh/MocA family oxidoreductase [Phycisphaerae bacterium]|nr:Gfo/Idh/MocA family oxidoreductase [Phycisphaerae bacterium]HOQ87052.1 Gfo/Idh/MocA family oxidoreductase [Phycisphaerae bacterium]